MSWRAPAVTVSTSSASPMMTPWWAPEPDRAVRDTLSPPKSLMWTPNGHRARRGFLVPLTAHHSRGQVSCSSCSRPSSRPQFWNLNPSDFFVRLLHIVRRVIAYRQSSSSQTGTCVCRADHIVLADHARSDACARICPHLSRHCVIREHLGLFPRRPATRGDIFGLHCLSLGSPSTVNRIPAGQLGCWDHL